MSEWIVTQIDADNEIRTKEIVADSRGEAGRRVDHAPWSKGWKVLSVEPAPPKLGCMATAQHTVNGLSGQETEARCLVL